MRHRLPLWIAFSFGTLLLVQYFFRHPVATSFYRNTLDWMQVVAVFSLIVGAVALAGMNLKAVAARSRGWGYNLVTLTGLGGMVLCGVLWGIDEHSPFTWVFLNLQVPLQSTMFSLLAFFVASAAYRGFRARSWPAGVLLLSAAIVILGRVPVGAQILSGLPKAADWVLNVPSMAARRGILIGIGLGAIATSLRVILGIERTYLGKEG